MQVWEVSVLWWPPIGLLSVMHGLDQFKRPCPSYSFQLAFCQILMCSVPKWPRMFKTILMICLWTPNSTWWLKVVPLLLAHFKHQPSRYQLTFQLVDLTGHPPKWLVPPHAVRSLRSLVVKLRWPRIGWGMALVFVSKASKASFPGSIGQSGDWSWRWHHHLRHLLTDQRFPQFTSRSRVLLLPCPQTNA